MPPFELAIRVLAATSIILPSLFPPTTILVNPVSRPGYQMEGLSPTPTATAVATQTPTPIETKPAEEINASGFRVYLPLVFKTDATLEAQESNSSDFHIYLPVVLKFHNLQADFAASPVIGHPPLTVTFVNSSTNASNYLWTFGDGITSTIVNPTHTYPQIGVYTVTLTAAGLSGSTILTRTSYITVTNPEIPISGLNAINDSPTQVGQFTTFTATVAAGSNITYTWNFGDGTLATSSGAVTHTYPAIGSYTAVVTASNAVSLITGTTFVAIIGVVDLAISKIAPSSAVVGEPITYTLTITNSGNLTATNLVITDVLPLGANYVSGGILNEEVVNWTIANLPPDSSAAVQFVVTATETITNSDYLVTADGGVSAAWQEPKVTMVHPLVSVDFSAAPLNGAVPLTVTFTNSSTNALSYWWDFGDSITSTEVSPTHIYTQPGVYTVTLAATGLSGSQTLSRPNYLTIYEPVVAEFIAAPLSGTMPLTVTFINSSSGASDYLWDFGDGITDTVVNPTHTYTQAGAYTVTLTATGSGGSRTLTRTNYITTYPGVIADFSAEPLSGTTPLTVTFLNSSTNAANYLWDFGDGETLTLVNPTHTYTQTGVYTVTLTASDGSLTNTLTRTHYITVFDPLVANFSATPLIGTVPLTVTFVNSSTNGTDYLWDFGDSSTLLVTSTMSTPAISLTHIYTQAGIYTITLALSNGIVTDTLTYTNYITVTAPVTRDWQQIVTTISPPIIGEHGLAYDSSRNVVVLYGGNAGGWPYENSTWEFDGTDWMTDTISGSPPARYGMGLAYDPMRQVTVLFGGSDESDTALNQTWEYTAAEWSQPTITGTVPASRSYASLVANPISGTIYLFGGNDSEIYFNDLWRYENGDWTEIIGSGSRPVSRTLTALAYDTDNNRLLLFGGRSVTGALLADLWAFDPVSETWTELDDGSENGPSARMAHTLTYDPDTGNTILVGGMIDEGDILLNDTWHYRNQAGWMEVSPPMTQPGVSFHQAIYGNNSIILFGNKETWRYE